MRSTVGIALELEDRLAQPLERLDQRIVVTKDHLVIQFAVDPALDDALDVAEVGDHVAAVEFGRAHVHFDDGVVPVRMFADAVVVEQPVSVAEIDALRDEIHSHTVTYRPCSMTASAVLFSGGLDSAVLLARELQTGRRGASDSRPRGTRVGTGGSAGDQPPAGRRAVRRPHPDPVSTLAVDMRDVYPPTHWAIVGQPPAYDTPDEDVYLEGRNITLLAKAAVLARADAHRPARHRAAGRKSVSRRHPEFFARDGPRALARTRARHRDRGALCRAPQGAGDRARRPSWVCHSS